ncbi:hypothetical protein EON83_17885 [bacterium]|nr:MAG: hypothetical protein EON83_17885 [bacterium]
MPTLTRGQKIRLAELTPATQLQVRLDFKATQDFDFSCFGLDDNGTLSDDRYFVFYNQKQSPQHEIRLLSFDARSATFSLDLTRLPPSVRHLVFVATVDGDGDMRGVESGSLSISDGKNAVADFAFTGRDFSEEKAVMIAEIYFKGEWRVAANGQGFKEGLSAILKHFGGQEVEENAPATPAPVTQPMTAPATPIETAPQLVTLKKADSTFKIDLGKSADEIIATAQWVDNGDKRSDNDDLDLRAGILFHDGRMSFVTYTYSGSLQKAPYVLHMGDVQNASRAQPGREQMKVNPKIAQLHGGKVAIVFSIYSAISNGAVSIASLKPIIELQYGNQIIKCDLDFSLAKAAREKYVYTYVIGLAIIDGQHIEITPGGQVSSPGSEATPWLTWNKDGGVTVTFDGPEVFKDEDISDWFCEDSSKRYI